MKSDNQNYTESFQLYAGEENNWAEPDFFNDKDYLDNEFSNALEDDEYDTEEDYDKNDLEEDEYEYDDDPDDDDDLDEDDLDDDLIEDYDENDREPGTFSDDSLKID